MHAILTIGTGVFVGIIFIIIFVWILASIIWLIYGKRYFAPDRENREIAMVPYFTGESQKIEHHFEDPISSESTESDK